MHEYVLGWRPLTCRRLFGGGGGYMHFVRPTATQLPNIESCEVPSSPRHMQLPELNKQEEGKCGNITLKKKQFMVLGVL
jgi:hypothetical protein